MIWLLLLHCILPLSLLLSYFLIFVIRAKNLKRIKASSNFALAHFSSAMPLGSRIKWRRIWLNLFQIFCGFLRQEQSNEMKEIQQTEIKKRLPGQQHNYISFYSKIFYIESESFSSSSCCFLTISYLFWVTVMIWSCDKFSSIESLSSGSIQTTSTLKYLTPFSLIVKKKFLVFFCKLECIWIW